MLTDSRTDDRKTHSPIVGGGVTAILLSMSRSLEESGTEGKKIVPVSAYSCILIRWSTEVLATGYHRSAMKLKHVRVCPTCTVYDVPLMLDFIHIISIIQDKHTEL